MGSDEPRSAKPGVVSRARAGALVVAAVAVVVAGGVATLRSEPPDPVVVPSSAGQLSTKGTRTVDARGRPVLLRGFNVIPIFEDLPGKTWEAWHYRRMRGLGLNVARFVLYWSDLEPSRGRFDEQRLATLDTAIARAREAGLYVVLDLVHLYDGDAFVPPWAQSGDGLADVSREGGRYLAMMARRYRDEPAVAAYDPINEPAATPIDQNRVLRTYDGLIQTIRREDPEKIVMIEPSFGDSDMRDADFGLLTDRRNLVLSVHDYYAGGAGEGYGPGLEQRGSYTWDGTSGYPSASRADLKAHMMAYVEPAYEAGLAVWVGELGIDPGAVNAERWVRDKMALLEEEGLGFAWWVYRPGPGLDVLESDLRIKPLIERGLR